MSCEFPKHPDRRVVKGLLLNEDGSSDMTPEEVVSYNLDSASDFLIKKCSIQVFPEKPNPSPLYSTDEPLPEAE